MRGCSEDDLTAQQFADQLPAGSVRMADVFALAKRFVEMDLEQVERLLESPVRELRVGAVRIMDFQARRRSTPEARRKALYQLYLRRHDRIDDWDLVDRAAPSVIGGYLADKPRDPLYDRPALSRCGNAAPQSSPPGTSSGTESSTTPLPLPSCSSTTMSTSSRPRSVGGCGRPSSATSAGCWPSSRHARRHHARTTLRYAIDHLADERRRYRSSTTT